MKMYKIVLATCITACVSLTCLSTLSMCLQTLGTAACPPYHLAIVIGGTSAEFTLKTVKLASTKYLDTLPTTGRLFHFDIFTRIWSVFDFQLVL